MAKLSVSCAHANFSHFYSGIFPLRIFCLFKCPLKLSKKCLLLFGNNSVKMWILFDTIFKQVNIVGSNSLKVSVLCDMNSEKSFYLKVKFGSNSLKMSVLIDINSGKMCSIVCSVTLRKCQYCLMFGKVCSIVW